MAASETAATITVLPAPQESPPAPFQLLNYNSCSSHLLAHHRHDQSRGATPSTVPFPTIDSCSLDNREMQTVVADLDGTLLRSSSSFPYFMLIAFEAGSPLRALLLLLISPLVYIFYHFISEAAGISLLIFVSCAGLKVSAIESAARAVLPKFYLEDMHPVSYKLFTACAHRYVVTANPRIMVEPFLKEYLGVDAVMGTEIQVSKSGYATGFVTAPGVLVGAHKEHAVKKNFGTRADDAPDVALGDRPTDYPFMRLCKEAYMVVGGKDVEAVPKEEYLKPLIFHDGRLVCRPTPLMCMAVILWTPIGLPLAILRISLGILFHLRWKLSVLRFLGVVVHVKGTPPPCPRATGSDTSTTTSSSSSRRGGVLFVCSHRTLLDPLFVSFVLRRPVTAVTYSISRVSEWLSPIKTVRLTRNRSFDANTMSTLLNEGDLVVCPEGTTCREPFLLRFSALFAELADQIVPVAMNIKITMFHGTTARGWKGLDPFFFFMNPRPTYEVSFLDQLPLELTCLSGAKTSHQVANYIQETLANSLGFQCTNLTRKDKYMVLAGNDGVVQQQPDQRSKLLQHSCSNTREISYKLY
jgi:glycerol-3-phosphate acyltransferase